MNLFLQTSTRARARRHTVVTARLLLFVACGLLGAAPAARAEGPGFKISESLVLHLGADIGAGFDSNVFFRSGNTGDPVVGAAYVALRPNLSIATLPSQRVGDAPRTLEFRLTAGLPLRFLTSNSEIINSHYSIGGDLNALLSIFPQGNYTFDLYENFLRTSEPPYAVIQACFDGAQANNINRIQNQLGARLRIRPGGRRFETTLQYTFGVNHIENSCLSAKSALTNDIHLRLKWNFFPKTAVYINANANIYTPYVDAFNTPPTAFPFRVVAGLKGLITPKFSIDANIGYGNSFTQGNINYTATAPAFSSVLALVELEWRPTATTILGLGYRHDFSPSLIGTYFTLDTAWVMLAQQIWRLTGNLRFGWDRRDYAGLLSPDGLANGRIDNTINLHVDLALPIKDWFFISIGNDLAVNLSNCRFLGPAGGPSCNYVRDDVWLRLSFAY